MSAWLSKEPAPDVRVLTLSELLEVWRKHRNDLLGVIAAEEVCRRLANQ